jgi:predicted NUDIX family phosphoesterase
LREDAHKLRQEKTTLEGMVQSHDELILEMAEEYGLKRMRENDDDEDDDNKGNTIVPPRLAAMPEEIVEEEALVENGSQELDGLNNLDDLDDDLIEGRPDMDEWFPQDGSNSQD